MKLQTQVKAGGTILQHNQTQVRTLEGISVQHNQTLVRKAS